MKFLYTILLVQGCQRVYEKINNLLLDKIRENDYRTIDVDKKYLRVRLSFNSYNLVLYVRLVRNTNKSENLNENSNFEINCNDKTIDSTVGELEDILLQEYIKRYDDFVVLIYDSPYIESHEYYHEIISKLKEINVARKEIRNWSDLFYDTIMEYDYREHEFFSKICWYTYFNDKRAMYGINPPIIYFNKGDCRFISFCIHLETKYYFFNIDVREFYEEEFFSMIEIENEYNNKIDESIGKCLHDLYKCANIDKFYTLGFCSLNSSDKKISFSGKTFNMKIKNDSLFVALKNNITYYCMKKDLRQFKPQIIIDQEFLTDFKKIFIRFDKINSGYYRHRAVEMFYRLLESNNKVDFFVNKIINKRGTALNMIFAYLMLNAGLINKSELNKILSNEQQDEIIKMPFIKPLLTKLSNHTLYVEIYAIKICIYIEAEEFIKENDISNDPVFCTLLEIENQIELKKLGNNFVNDSTNMNSRTKFDFYKIYQGAIAGHIENIENFKKIVWENIFKITSLFTVSMESVWKRCFDQLHTNKEEVISKFSINSNDVENNNEIIKKKLDENFSNDIEKENKFKCKKEEMRRINEDIRSKEVDKKRKEQEIRRLAREEEEKKRKKEAEIKQKKEEILNFLQNITKSTLNIMLNKTLYEANNRSVDNLYDENMSNNFENELLNEGINNIDTLLSYESVKEKVKNVNEKIYEDMINEYKNSEINKFCQKLKENMAENLKNDIKINSKKYVISILTCLFRASLGENKGLINKHEENFSIVKKFMNKKEILRIIDICSKNYLHENLIETIKMFENI
ncbi:uncharacterized protein VNE69_10057 [Vairimorpha necatrix]|uniref:Uncharacterized protein n=1 Tax=Vairimorpha necatrix TaxID=6039 RepID=A0AAX4JFF5_9MICR